MKFNLCNSLLPSLGGVCHGSIWMICRTTKKCLILRLRGLTRGNCLKFPWKLKSKCHEFLPHPILQFNMIRWNVVRFFLHTPMCLNKTVVFSLWFVLAADVVPVPNWHMQSLPLSEYYYLFDYLYTQHSEHCNMWVLLIFHGLENLQLTVHHLFGSPLPPGQWYWGHFCDLQCCSGTLPTVTWWKPMGQKQFFIHVTLGLWVLGKVHYWCFSKGISSCDMWASLKSKVLAFSFLRVGDGWYLSTHSDDHLFDNLEGKANTKRCNGCTQDKSLERCPVCSFCSSKRSGSWLRPSFGSVMKGMVGWVPVPTSKARLKTRCLIVKSILYPLISCNSPPELNGFSSQVSITYIAILRSN